MAPLSRVTQSVGRRRSSPASATAGAAPPWAAEGSRPATWRLAGVYVGAAGVQRGELAVFRPGREPCPKCRFQEGTRDSPQPRGATKSLGAESAAVRTVFLRGRSRSGQRGTERRGQTEAGASRAMAGRWKEGRKDRIHRHHASSSFLYI